MGSALTSSRAFTAQAPPCAFVADDSEEQRWLVRHMLGALGFEVREQPDGRALFWALERARRAEPELDLLVIADVRMPVYDGLSVLEAWRRERWPHPFVVMTGFPDAEVSRRVDVLGGVLLPKPFTLWELGRALARTGHRAATPEWA